MGRFAETVFGRKVLPSRCLVFGGVYASRRARVVLKHFDSWTRPSGNWIKYTYAKRGSRQYLVCFNVYGGTTTLELLHVLRDGNAKSVFFLGSMGSARLEIGQVVLPYKVVDRAGIVALDSPDNPVVEIDGESIESVERALRDGGVSFVKGKTASVPAVLHSIKGINDYISGDKGILGVELELSTFHYFGRKLGLRTYGLLYVWDNPSHDIISGPMEVWKIRMKALDKITQVALGVIE